MNHHNVIQYALYFVILHLTYPRQKDSLVGKDIIPCFVLLDNHYTCVIHEFEPISRNGLNISTFSYSPLKYDLMPCEVQIYYLFAC